jgi:hypothetical protein
MCVSRHPQTAFCIVNDYESLVGVAESMPRILVVIVEYTHRHSELWSRAFFSRLQLAFHVPN